MMITTNNPSQRYKFMSRPSTFITNIDIDDISMTLQVASDVGIVIEIQEKATDAFDNLLLTCASVHTNELREKRNEFIEAMVAQIMRNNERERSR